MPLWTALIGLAVGSAAGAVAWMIMLRFPSSGRAGDVAFSFLGAIVGGYGLSLLGGSGRAAIVGMFLVALIVACAFLWLVRIVEEA